MKILLTAIYKYNSTVSSRFFTTAMPYIVILIFAILIAGSGYLEYRYLQQLKSGNYHIVKGTLSLVDLDRSIKGCIRYKYELQYKDVIKIITSETRLSFKGLLGKKTKTFMYYDEEQKDLIPFKEYFSSIVCFIVVIVFLIIVKVA